MQEEVTLNLSSDEEWQEQGLMSEQDGDEHPISDPLLLSQLEKDFE